MKSLVMIAYDFPPEGNAGAHRPLRFVRRLPSAGWQPTVVTRHTTFHERYDPSLLGKVPQNLEVIRVRNTDPWLRLQEWRGKRAQKKNGALPTEKLGVIREAEQAPLRSWVREAIRTAEAWGYHPDPARGWIRPAVKAALDACDRKHPSVLWATAGPVSSFIVAQKVSARTHLPYVLDFRDAWTITYNEFEARRPAWAVRKDRRKMFELLKGAQAVIFRYETEAECYWRAYPGALEPSHVHIIPNGYEGMVEKFVVPSGDGCAICYAGTLVSYRYDSFLQALRLLKQTSPEISKHLHCLFIGEGTQALANDAAELGVSEMVIARGPMLQEEVCRFLKSAHGLLILGRPETIAGYELIAAAKVFDYLKAGKPIIAILPADETKNTLLRVGVTTIADVNSVPEILAVLRKLAKAWLAGTLHSLLPDSRACEVYSAQEQTEELVRALEGMPPKKRFVPGAVEVPRSLRSRLTIEQTRLHT